MGFRLSLSLSLSFFRWNEKEGKLKQFTGSRRKLPLGIFCQASALLSACGVCLRARVCAWVHVPSKTCTDTYKYHCHIYNNSNNNSISDTGSTDGGGE